MKEKLLREPEGHATRPSAGVKRAAPVEKPVKSFKERGQDLKEKETEKEKTEEKTGFFSRMMTEVEELMRAEYTKFVAVVGLLNSAVGFWGFSLAVKSLSQGITVWEPTGTTDPPINVTIYAAYGAAFLIAGVNMLTFAALSLLTQRKLRRAEGTSAQKVEEATAEKKGMLGRLGDSIDKLWEKNDKLVLNTGISMGYTGMGMLGVGMACMLLPTVPVITGALLAAGITLSSIGMMVMIIMGNGVVRDIRVKKEKTPEEKAAK